MSSGSLSTASWTARTPAQVDGMASSLTIGSQAISVSAQQSPDIFDNLSFAPDRDIPCVIRKNPLTNSVIAATSPRLIALLTQHDVLDYSQMLDFFICYRAYMSSSQLLDLLMARFSWALNYHINHVDTEIGRDVAVRTFVVLRHWILNFFPDDFVPRFQLRSQFCIALNKLCNWYRYQIGGPDSNSSRHVAIIRIFEQLKKAWLRLCQMYWPVSPCPDDENVLLIPLSPGGVIGGENRMKTRMSANKRKSIISSFIDNESPKPVLDQNELNFNHHGNIIGGGVKLTSDILSTKPPNDEIIDQDTSQHLHQFYLEQSNQPVTSSFKKFKIPRFFQAFRHHSNRTRAHSTKHSYSLTDLQIPEDHVDLLSNQVVKQLTRFLHEKEKGKRHINSMYAATDSRTSFVDSLDIQRQLARTSEEISLDGYDFDAENHSLMTNSECDFEIDHGRRNSTNSFVSISTLSATTTILRGTLRRQDHMHNIHAHISTAFDSDVSTKAPESVNVTPNLATRGFSMITVDSMGTSIDTGSSSLTISDSGHDMYPNENHDPYPPGVDPEAAAELAAIPDDTPVDDAILAALEKLEGTYVKKSREFNGSIETPVQSMEIPEPPKHDNDKEESFFRDSRYVNLCSETDLVKTNLATSSIDDKTIQVSESYKSFNTIGIVGSTSQNSNLYSAAFQSRYNIDQLASGSIGENDTNHDTTSIDTSSSESLSEFHDTKESVEELRNSRNEEVQPTPPDVSELDIATNATPSPIQLEQGSSTATSPIEQSFEWDSSIIRESNNHVPFILYYDTKSLADQFALIERDALAEIDWNELVELRWTKPLMPVQSWLIVLVENQYTGIDLVVSRFNLMVNWVKSEIILTRNDTIRAAVISKFIRIADCARQMQNYATMMQVVLGLMSDLIQNKMNSNTWQLVPEQDIAILKKLDTLISPIKNFQNLRHEVNSMDPSKGCIPFIGIYLSDLTANDERASYLDYGPVPMINLDKMHITSSIVRSFLQCIEWSSMHGDYQLDSNLLAKCLYIHCLTVEEMDQSVGYINSM